MNFFVRFKSKIKQYIDKKSELEFFIFKSIFLFLLYALIKGLLRKGFILHPIAVFFNNLVRTILVNISEFYIQLLGLIPVINNNVIKIGESNGGVIIVNDCLAWNIISGYLGFIIAFPGNKKQRIYFIIFGIIAIILLNALRITGLTLILHYYPDYWKFYHVFIFKFILYTLVLIMIYFWIKTKPKYNTQ